MGVDGMESVVPREADLDGVGVSKGTGEGVKEILGKVRTGDDQGSLGGDEEVPRPRGAEGLV